MSSAAVYQYPLMSDDDAHTALDAVLSIDATQSPTHSGRQQTGNMKSTAIVDCLTDININHTNNKHHNFNDNDIVDLCIASPSPSPSTATTVSSFSGTSSNTDNSSHDNGHVASAIALPPHTVHVATIAAAKPIKWHDNRHKKTAQNEDMNERQSSHSDSDDERAPPHVCYATCDSDTIPCYRNLHVIMSAGRVPIVYPTMKQFSDFNRLVHHIYQIYHDSGICKVVPPVEWEGYNTSYHNIDQTVLVEPIRQHVLGSRGIYRLIPVIEHENEKQRNKQKSSHSNNKHDEIPIWTVGSFKREAVTAISNDVARILLNNNPYAPKRYKHDTTAHLTADQFVELERKFWKSITFSPPIYAADTDGALFLPSLKVWNVASLPTMLNAMQGTVRGMNSPYLYAGMWKAMFGIHTEDMDLFSINYIHMGAAKQWYCIPPSQCDKFEKFAQTTFYDDFKQCPNFLRHKHTMIAPWVLRETAGVQVNQVVHNAGEFMLTFPRAYHFGYNVSFNVAESLNFALPSWLPLGKQVSYCRCKNDTAMLDVGALQQEIYKWLKTQDADMEQWHREQLAALGCHEERWYFHCICGASEGVSSLSTHSHPSGEMFQCACCSCLSHIKCYYKYRHRKPTYVDCEPVADDAQHIVRNVLSTMLQVVSASSAITPSKAQSYYDTISQHEAAKGALPMYCYRCVPVRHFTRLKMLYEGELINTVTPRYWSDENIAYLKQLERGEDDDGNSMVIDVSDDTRIESGSEQSYHDGASDSDDIIEVGDAEPSVVTLPQQRLSPAAQEIKVMIDRDMLNPAMPRPDTQCKIHAMYQKNLFNRLKIVKIRNANAAAAAKAAVPPPLPRPVNPNHQYVYRSAPPPQAALVRPMQVAPPQVNSAQQYAAMQQKMHQQAALNKPQPYRAVVMPQATAASSPPQAVPLQPNQQTQHQQVGSPHAAKRPHVTDNINAYAASAQPLKRQHVSTTSQPAPKFDRAFMPHSTPSNHVRTPTSHHGTTTPHPMLNSNVQPTHNAFPRLPDLQPNVTSHTTHSNVTPAVNAFVAPQVNAFRPQAYSVAASITHPATATSPTRHVKPCKSHYQNAYDNICLPKPNAARNIPPMLQQPANVQPIQWDKLSTLPYQHHNTNFNVNGIGGVMNSNSPAVR